MSKTVRPLVFMRASVLLKLRAARLIMIRYRANPVLLSCGSISNNSELYNEPGNSALASHLEQLCAEKNIRMTGQRRVIAQVLEAAADHPDVEELHRRSAERDPKISISTVYRTVRLFEDLHIIERHDFRDGRSRYEAMPDNHHDHLIDLKSGKVFEFSDPRIEALQEEICRELGFKLVDHRLELYAVPVRAPKKKKF
jgi:Fur family transcriptional regulator, ferric uptake regulator